MRVAELAAGVGKGLFAGLAGTVAMTISSTLETKARGRQSSDTPARAAAKVLGVEPVGEKEKSRFSRLVHFAYGTSWGAVRGVIGAAGLQGPAAAGLFFGAVWGNQLLMLPALGVAPPPTKWGATQLATDAFHHLVYATVTSLAYSYLDSGEDAGAERLVPGGGTGPAGG